MNELTLSTQDLVPTEAPVSIELGSAPLDVDSMKQLDTGSLVTLDRQVNDPVDVLVEGRLVARGELIVVEDELAVRIVEYGDRVNGVLHCFAGGEELLQTAVDMGWYVSFSGLVTFVDELEGLVEKVPLDRILVETDAPYLAPSPKRGKRNEPSFLPYVCERLAKILGISFDDMAMATTENSCRFYHLRDHG
mgnify:CR=1 FL=1